MLEIQLIDRTFSHEEYTVPQKYSSKIKWFRNYNYFFNNDLTVYSHASMFNKQASWDSFVRSTRYSSEKQKRGKSIGLVFESQSIFQYQEVERVINEFDIVFTHSSALLEKYSNTRWIPGGGIWVGGSINRNLLGGSDGEIKIYDKSKNISMVSSGKSMCKLHLDRLNLANYLFYNDEYRSSVDMFGTFNDDKQKWIPIIDALKDYRFSIVIENFIDKQYFTEKLLNCFATGTIPIYIGATELGGIFDVNGIIQCSSIQDVVKFINQNKESLSEIYTDKLDSINKNFELCKQYELIEDYIYDHYLPELS
jgi:hypothetical protein